VHYRFGVDDFGFVGFGELGALSLRYKGYAILPFIMWYILYYYTASQVFSIIGLNGWKMGIGNRLYKLP